MCLRRSCLAVIFAGTAAFAQGDPKTIAANEAATIAALKKLVSIEDTWRQTDSDRNGVQDYWVRDVAGFCYIHDAAGIPLKYIEEDMAEADRAGLGTYSYEPAHPKDGYWFRALVKKGWGEYVDDRLPAPADPQVADKPSTNDSQFGFCAHPAEYGVTGVLTFIVNEEGVVYAKDRGVGASEAILTWPGLDPALSGWRPAVEVEDAVQEATGPLEANQASASKALQQLVSIQGLWWQNDSDRNGAQDWWARDIAGLYYVTDADGQELKYIAEDVAKADRTGLAPYSKDAPTPLRGYWLRAMVRDENGNPYVDESRAAARAGPVSGLPCTNLKYAFCAYPAEYGVTGKLTYILNEDGLVWEKDLGPNARHGVEVWPDECVTSQGWEIAE